MVGIQSCPTLVCTPSHTTIIKHTFYTTKGRCLEAAFLFAVLLNLKHIFLYMAPAFFVYLLKHYCFSQSPSPPGSPCHAPKRGDFLLTNFVKLGVIVVAVFALSFGPFVYMVCIFVVQCIKLLMNDNPMMLSMSHHSPLEA